MAMAPIKERLGGALICSPLSRPCSQAFFMRGPGQVVAYLVSLGSGAFLFGLRFRRSPLPIPRLFLPSDYE